MSAYIRTCGQRVDLDEEALGRGEVRVDANSLARTCGECGANFVDAGRLDVHLGRREVWCDECGASFEVEEEG